MAPGAPCSRSDCPAEDLRIVYQGAGSPSPIDTSTNGLGVTEIYDSASNTVYETPSPTASFQPPEPIDYLNVTNVDPLSPGFRAALRHLIATGQAHVVGNTTLGARQVIQIASRFVACGPPRGGAHRPAQRHLVKARTAVRPGLPVDLRRGPGQLRPGAGQSTFDGQTNTIAYTTYQTLPAAGNMDVFNLAAQHPGARVDGGAADYQAEVGRICGAEGLSPNIETCTAAPDPDRGSSIVQAPQAFAP